MQADSKLKHYAVELLAKVPGEIKTIDKREFQLHQKQMFLYKGTTFYLGQTVPFAVLIVRIASCKYRIKLVQLYYNHLNTFSNRDFWQMDNPELPMNFYQEMFGTDSLQAAEDMIGGHLADYDEDVDMTYLDYAKPAMAEFLHYLEHGIKPLTIDTNANVEVLSDLNKPSVRKAKQPGPVFIIESDPIGALIPVFVKTIQMYIKMAAKQAEVTSTEINLDEFSYQLLEGNYVRQTVLRYLDTDRPAVEFTLNVNRGFNVTVFTPKGKIEKTQSDTLPGNVFRLNQELQKINCEYPDKLGIFKLNDLLQ